MREGEKWGRERSGGRREVREGERKVKGAKKEQRERERERGSPYLASVEYKLNEMHDNASTNVLHAELLPKLMTHREGHSWLNEFLDEEEGEGGREGGRGGGGKREEKGGEEGGREEKEGEEEEGEGGREEGKGEGGTIGSYFAMAISIDYITMLSALSNSTQLVVINHSPTKLRCSCAQRIRYLQLAQGGLQPTLDGGIESGAVFI